MRKLKTWLESNYPQISRTGGYSCRHIVGDRRYTSVHATGRALDIHIRRYRRKADNDKGDPIANYLLSHAQELGIQTIIWDQSIWTSSRAVQGVRYYSGKNRHTDHLHIEITPNAPVRTKSACTDTIKANGGTIDNTSACFETFGNQKYWRKENTGFGGTLIWTNATKSSAAQNWARWNLNVEKAGKYKVMYHSTSAFAKFNSTKYKVKSGNKKTEITIDQSAGGNGWEEIGTFDFVKGQGQWVTVADNSRGSVAKNQHIVADAIRLEPANSAPSRGELKITLEWTAPTDLDIHVRTPNGKVISGDIADAQSADGGRLVKDACYKDACSGDAASASNPHQEIVSWQADRFVTGRYAVWAVNFDGAARAPFKIIFEYPDGRKEVKTATVSAQKRGASVQFNFYFKAP